MVNFGSCCFDDIPVISTNFDGPLKNLQFKMDGCHKNACRTKSHFIELSSWERLKIKSVGVYEKEFPYDDLKVEMILDAEYQNDGESAKLTLMCTNREEL